MGQLSGTPPAPLIIINSFLNVEESEIADDLANLFPSAVVDDFTEFPLSEAKRDAHRKATLVNHVFPEEEAAKAAIIVDSYYDNERGEKAVSEIETAARVAGRRFVHVNLICDLAVHLERITDIAERRLWLEEVLMKQSLFRFPAPKTFTVDVTLTPSKTAAKTIFDYIRSFEGVICDDAVGEEGWEIVSKTQ